MDSAVSPFKNGNARGQTTAVAAALVLLAVGQGCAPVSADTDLKDTFFSQFVDTKLVRSEGHTTFKSDGTFFGEAFGGSLQGEWEWKNNQFCRSGSFDSDPFPYACEKVTISGTELTLSGPDGAFTYTRP
ncbi:hypothetical protein [Ruegeria sp. HKCCD8929]|uniref:hypothetical protein n=1 Tax=Ruegeria sp. HKCCD8929 TaxID=2683006 RepID=UPI0014895110|nr:hypothetical protein [Ruegeria sp. HKCCD8929]